MSSYRRNHVSKRGSREQLQNRLTILWFQPCRNTIALMWHFLMTRSGYNPVHATADELSVPNESMCMHDYKAYEKVFWVQISYKMRSRKS